MNTEPQQSRSLPRNRKCGNCRHFEPAPLWRKGWCRNSMLYPPHANHLVDSNELDCESGFRSRIYWEPLPQSAPQPAREPGVVKIQEHLNRNMHPVQPMGANFKPTEYRHEELEHPVETEPYVRLPEHRDMTGWRAEVRKRLKFTENWPLERFELNHLMMWGAALFVLFVALVVLISSLGKPSTSPAGVTATAAVATQNAQSTVLQINSPVPGQTRALTPGQSPAAATTTSPLRAGKVVGLGGDALNLRTEPKTTAKILLTLKEGDLVSILEGPSDADGQSWYKVQASGQTGWVSKRYIQLD